MCSEDSRPCVWPIFLVHRCSGSICSPVRLVPSGFCLLLSSPFWHVPWHQRASSDQGVEVDGVSVKPGASKLAGTEHSPSS